MRSFDIPARRPFFETLVQLVIGLLFVSISATITPASLRHLVLPTIGLVAVLVLAVRPVVAALATLRTELSRGERAFTGWMASSRQRPRQRSPRRCQRTGSGVRRRSCPLPSWSSR